MSSIADALLAKTIDDHIAWITGWSRVAFFVTDSHAMRADSCPLPDSFSVWRHEAAKTLQDQPALERLVELHEQMQTLARLAIMKAPEGAPVDSDAYETVAAKHQEFIIGLRRLERALATAASGLDTLTGLRSRSGMQEELARELSRVGRGGKPFCLALMDIDHFKKINDSYGHENGDKVLASVAAQVSRSLRPFDDAWRWGGEEILLCLKEADLFAGGTAVERLRVNLEKTPVTLKDGRSVAVTASFGVVEAVKDVKLEDLLALTDRALYRAKNSGRNKVELGSAARKS